MWDVKGGSAKKPPPMLLVGNKSDAEDREVWARCCSTWFDQTKVLMAVGHAKATEWHSAFAETSAKTRVWHRELYEFCTDCRP